MKTQHWAPRIYAPILLGQALVVAFAPAQVLLWSYGFVLAALFFTLWLCWRRSTISVAHNRPFWRVLLLALTAKTIAFVLLTLDAWITTRGTLVSIDPAFYFCIAALLMVVATTFTSGALTTRWTIGLDGILALALAWMFYDLLHVEIHPAGQGINAALYLLHMFDGMGLFVAVSATIRLFATRRADERRFFFVLMVYAWLDALCAGAHNRLILTSDSYLSELFQSVPVAMLGLLLSVRRKAWLRGYRPSPLFVNLVAGLIPFGLSFALCVLALQRTLSSPLFGGAMVLLAVVIYGIRNALVLAHHLTIEEERRGLRRNLQRSAFRDELTGLRNRRGIQRTFSRVKERAREMGHPLAIAMMDIDHFKTYNDTYGHQAGDDCLALVGAALRQCTRTIPGAAIGRYGGEEFLIVMEGLTKAEAARSVERLRQSIDDLHIVHAGTSSGQVSISAGLAIRDPGQVETIEALIKTADEALYDAKAMGRNRLQVASS
jgi:diguanylate cyclase (GGDEF)-like protein